MGSSTFVFLCEMYTLERANYVRFAPFFFIGFVYIVDVFLNLIQCWTGCSDSSHFSASIPPISVKIEALGA